MRNRTRSEIEGAVLEFNGQNISSIFFKTDTSGEKSFEEFYTKSDEVDMDTFDALGVIKNSVIPLKSDIDQTLRDFRKLFDAEDVNKAKIVSLISKYLPDFSHIETGKSLDQKM